MSLTETRCWVLHRPDATPYTDGPDPHYPNPDEARQDLAEIREDRGDEAPADLDVIAVPHRCLFLVCDCCGFTPQDIDHGGVAHHVSLPGARQAAEEAGWRLDPAAPGRALCEVCADRLDRFTDGAETAGTRAAVA